MSPRQDPRRDPRPDTVNEKLLNRTIRHLLYLTRITTTEVNEIVSRLRNEVYPDLIDELLPDINRIRNMSEGGALTSSQITALSATSAALNETIVSQMTRMREFLTGRLLEIGKTEAAFELGLFRNAIPIEVNFSVPSESQLRAIINNQPLDGVPISEWFDKMGADTNRRVMREIRQGMIEGEGIDAIVRRIRGRRSAGFTDGVLNTTTNDAERLVRTAVIDTSYQSRRAFFEENEEYIKGEKIVATLDSRTCTECMRREQETAERPLPLGEGARPPFHPNCLLPDALVTPRGDITGVSKRWYDGDVIVFKTASGNELTCTPNHPILTDRGFVSAGSLDIGCNVISDGLSQREGTCHGNNVDKPSRIHDVVESFLNSSKVTARPVPVTPVDFHGDGAGSKVAVIGANSLLHSGTNTSVDKHSTKINFVVRYMSVILRSISFPGFRAFAERFKRNSDAFCSIMSGFYLRFLFFIGHLRPFKNLCFTSRADVDFIFNKPSPYNTSGGVEFFRELFFRNPTLVKLDNFIYRHLFSCAPHLNPVLFKPSDNYGFGNTELLGDVTRTNAGHIKRDDFIDREIDSFSHEDKKLALQILNKEKGPNYSDEVVSVEKRLYSGYVYNIETTERYYIANGITSHNCRCTVVAVTKSFRELGIDLDEAPEGTRSSMDGQVPASMTYEDWLRRQDDDVIEEALGKTRAKLFKEGKLSVSSFTDRQGRRFTLDELRQRESDAFEAAGLNED